MNSKKKTIFALTVKLMLAAVCVQAQNHPDSIKQKSFLPPPLYINFSALKQIAPLNPVPGNYYAKQLPFFCSKELKVQKAVGFPVKFRLGSVEYCDKLEGKNK